MKTKIQHLITSSFTLTLALFAVLVNQATAADETLASSESAVGTITVNTPDSYTIGVGSTATRTLTNAIVLDGGNLKGGVMDNVATVSGLSGAGTSTTSVDTNGVTITLEGSGLTDTTANLTLASGVTVTGANQFLVGGGAGGGGNRSSRNDGGGGGGGFVVLTTGNLSDTLTLTAGGGSAGQVSGGAATASGGSSAIGATTAAGGGGAASAGGYPTGKGGDSGQTISGTTTSYTGGIGSKTSGTGNGGGGGGAGSSANGSNGSSANVAGAGGAGTQITTGVVDIATYLGSDTFGGGGGGGAGDSVSAGGTGGGGNGAAAGVAGTDGLGGGGGGAGRTNGGNGGAGSVAIQYAYDSNVAAGALTLSGGITLNSTSTLDAVRSGGLIDVTTNAITGTGGLNIASSDSPGGVVRLSAANTYTGATTIDGGELEIGGAGTLGSGSYAGTITNNGTLNYNSSATQTLNGVISGTGALIKDDSSTLTLSGANTYSGTTTVSAGTLQISGAGSLSTSSAVVNNANLIYGTTIASDTYGLSSSTTGTGSLTGTAQLIQLNGGITQGTVNLTSGTSGGLYGQGIELVSNTTITAGSITLTGDLGRRSKGGTLALDTSGTNGAINLDVSIGRSGAWYGFDSFTADTGTGTLTVSGANAGSGGWRGTSSVSLTGNLDISSSFSLSGTGAGSLDLTATGNSSVSGNLGLVDTTNTWTVNPGLTMDVSGAISGTNAAITKDGTGTLTLSGANTYSGLTTVNSGTLTLATAGALSDTGGNYQINNDATLQTNVGINIGGRTFTFGDGGSGTINFTGGNMAVNGTTFVTTGGLTNYISGSLLDQGTINYNVADGTDDVDLEVSNSINRGGITKNGAGTLSLTSTFNNLQTNTTTINAGVLELGGEGRLVNGNYSGAINNDGIFRHNSTNDQTLNGVISGTGAIEKNNTSTLTLTGANTYQGTTSVSNGTLALSAADNNIASSVTIDVATGATLDVSGITNGFELASGQTLSGSGTVAGGMTLTSGSVLSPGNSPGTMATGAQTWLDGGSYLWEINDSATWPDGAGKGQDPGWDWLDINGSLDLSLLSAGGFTIDIDSLTSGNIAGDAVGFDTWTKGAPGDFDYSFTIATFDSLIGTFDASLFTLDSSGFTNGPSWDWQIKLSGNDLVLEAYAVPEPSSAALLGLGGLALMLRRKRS
jgi:autotransporter-associated beta strand protein